MAERHDPLQYASYIEAGKTPFGKLGRMWECETWTLGLSQGADTPPEVGERRWKDFWATWEKSEKLDGVQP